jgi:hypothetical protein
VFSTRSCKNTKISDEVHQSTLWGIRFAEGRRVTECLFALYSLNKRSELPNPIRYGPGMTHEFTVVDLDPAIKINFHRNLWDQSKLRPILPVMIGFQFHAVSDAAAAERIQLLVDMVMRQEFPPYIQSEWLPHFRDGLDITTPLLDMDDIRAGSFSDAFSNAEVSHSEEYTSEVHTFRPQAKPSKLWGNVKLGLIATVSASAAIILTNQGSSRVAVPAGEWHRNAHDTFEREMVTEDGSIRHFRLFQVVGYPSRYSIQLLAKHPLTIQPHKEKPESSLLGDSEVAAEATYRNDED